MTRTNFSSRTSYNTPLARVVIDSALIVGALVWPWWLSLAALAALALYFKYFFEALVVGLFLDALFAAPVATLGGFRLFFTFSAVVILGIATLVRRRMRV